MQISEELTKRGFVYQFSGDSLSDVLDGEEKRVIYLGIDPTADAIHVGNLVPYMLLNHLMQAGHKVILLLGGATALIGDPSGRDTERDFVDVTVVKERAAQMKEKVLKLTTSENMEFVNNYDWLSEISVLDFLRDVGKHFTVNAMIKKESVERRLNSEHGISFTEFSYSLLQGYDFYHLYSTHGCTFQIGGSDQWGNIIAGVDYVRRMTGTEVFGLTMPLVVDKSTGKKFGKSAGNAIWLDPEKTSPYAFYQFWLNTSDESVEEYLKLFTFMSLEEIDTLMELHQQAPEKRAAQTRLAREVTQFVHKEDAMRSALRVSELFFGDGKLEELEEADIATLLENAPVYKVTEGDVVVDVLVGSGLAASKREARTFLESGAVSINGQKIDGVEQALTAVMFHNNVALLRRGKKSMCVLQKT